MSRRKKHMSFYDLLSELVDGDLSRDIDPRNMAPDDRHTFIDTVYADYLYFKKNKSVHAERYKALLVDLIKNYSH